MPLLGFWEKLYLLCWKNTKVSYLFRYAWCLSIVVPSLFVTVLLFMRMSLRVQTWNEEIYKPVNMKDEWIKMTQRVAANNAKLANQEIHLHNCFLPQLTVAYAPNNSVFNGLMTFASSEYLDNVKLIAFENHEALRTALQAEHFLAGVSFNMKSLEMIQDEKSFSNFSDGSLSLNFSLIFPSELRFFYNTFIGQSWRTNVLIRPYAEMEMSNSTENDHYIREGFISLQNAISMAFIHLSYPKIKVPDIQLNQFPRRERIYDPMLDHFPHVLPFLIVLGYLTLLTQFSIRIIVQKMSKRKKMFKALDISNSIITATWFISGYLWFIFPSIFVIILLKFGGSDFRICRNSSWLILLLVFTCYNFSCIGFCLMLSSAVETVPELMILTSIVWVYFFLPFYFILQNDEGTPSIFLSIFSNTLFGFALKEVFELEKMDEGLQWHNLFGHSSLHNSVGMQSFFLLLLSILYTLVGVAFDKIPILLGRLKKNMDITIEQHRKSEMDFNAALKSSSSFIRSRAQVLEIKGEDQVVFVEVKGLTKYYGKSKAIENVSLCFYEGEISVIMGHNGSGKTTLISILAGVVPPTHGSIIFNQEVFSLYSKDGVNIGIGIQNMLHPGLSVANEIFLHSRLKGLSEEEAREDVEKYLSAMGLEGVANVVTNHLNDCLKRSVIVCCALCGNSKFVVLDEPSTGMDAMAKKKFWDLIIREKAYRTIILSTHSIREAQILADHLLVLSAGKVQCYGSVYFLKSLYGRGYRLVCMKAPQCKTTNITEFLRRFIPYISPESDIGQEVSYRLHERNFEIFPKILTNLEESFEELNIIGCSFSEPTIEDIVTLMGSEGSTRTEGFRVSEVLRGFTLYSDEYINYTFMKEYVAYKGLKLLCSQLIAMFLKHYYNRSNISKILHYFLIPALTLCITFVTSNPHLDRETLVATTIRMTQYSQSVTTVFLDTIPEYSAAEYELLAEYINNLPFLCMKHKVEIIRRKHIIDHLMDIQNTEMDEDFNSRYLVGVSFEMPKPTAWFNNYWLHTAPLSLNLLHNSLLAMHGYKGRIIVNHDPLPFSINQEISTLNNLLDIESILPMMISLLVCLIYSHFIFYAIHERRFNFKLAQIICGIQPITYYLGAIMYDVLKIILISLTVLITLLLFHNLHSFMSRFAVFCFILMIIFGICLLPFYYLVSIFFTHSSLVYSYVCLHGIIGVSFFVALTEPIGANEIEQMKVASSYTLLRYLLPHFTLCQALSNVFIVGKARSVCANKDMEVISLKLDECITVPYCCIDRYEYSSTDWGIRSGINYFLIIGALSTILLVLYESKDYIRRLLGYTVPLDDRDLAKEDFMREHEQPNPYQRSVIEERIRLSYTPRSKYYKKPVVMSNVTKLYKNRRVGVSRFTLLLEEGECFGLIGINGSGKSTIIKLLVGQEKISCGRAYVHGISVLKNLTGAYKYIGYCPSLDGYMSAMTCRQIIQFFCRIRGMPTDLIVPVTESLGKVLGLMSNYDKRIYNTSPGIKKRMRAAISFIGRPSVLYFDKHMVGIDPAGRRQYWNILHRMQSFGTSILFTAQSPYDPERFCTRIGILHKGHLLCVDNLYHLQMAHEKIYILQIKLKPSSIYSQHDLQYEDDVSNTSRASHRSSLPLQITNVQTFMETLYPKSILKHHHGLFMSYRIPSEDTSVSQIYKKVKRHAFFLKVDSFSINWETMSILFNELMEKENSRGKAE